MKEKNFLTEYCRGLGMRNCWYYKIPDTPKFDGNMSRFTLQKPFDLIVLEKGLFIAVETKMCKSMSLGYDSIQEHQVRNLLAVEESGGVGVLMVCFRVPETKKRKAVFRAFAFDIKNLPNLQYDRKSIPLSWFEENALEMRRDKVGGNYIWL